MAGRKDGPDDPAVASFLQKVREESTDVGEVVSLLRRETLPLHAYLLLTQEERWMHEYSIILELCRNPRVPTQVTVGVAYRLLLHDLSKITRDVNLPVVLRQKATGLLRIRLKVLPKGDKLTIARTGGNAMASALLWDEDVAIVREALLNSRLREKDLYPLINHAKTGADVLSAIANSKRWHERYRVRYLLARNPRLPKEVSLKIIETLLSTDLQELAENTRLDQVVRGRARERIEAKVLALDAEERLMLARYGKAHQLDALVRNGNIAEYRQLLLNPEIKVSQLLTMLRTESGKVFAENIKRHKSYKKVFKKNQNKSS